jgi:hypothetical protein
MTYSTSFKKQFTIEFSRFPTDQQDKVLEFTETFEEHGLSDFNMYPGKISPSWGGNATPAAAAFAQANDMWHYHVGVPSYTQVHGKYKTSDWVLHFQWINRGQHVDILDLYSHYRYDGSFYLPGAGALA